MENKKSFEISVPAAIVLAGIILSLAIIYNNKLKYSDFPNTIAAVSSKTDKSELEKIVLPAEGISLPASWNNMGKKLVSAGVIDGEKLKALYLERGQFSDEFQKLLFEENNGQIVITEKNSVYLLNLFWALGLSNSNPVLNDQKEMKNPSYGGAGNFASTGGWTMAMGDTMNHYGWHTFFELTSEQQTLVEKMSRGIYRPCCNNSTHFPDCNHGMAMLGLLELMASQGAGEQEMWKAALAVNSYWFPNNYLTIASYLKNRGIEWQKVNPQEILGINYSSASGYAKVSAEVSSPKERQPGGCSV